MLFTNWQLFSAVPLPQYRTVLPLEDAAPVGRLVLGALTWQPSSLL